MGERLRKIAEHRALLRIVFFAVKAEVVRALKQPLEHLLRFVSSF
jgi:hypothetical protein